MPLRSFPFLGFPALLLAVASLGVAAQRPRYGGELRRLLLAPVIERDPVAARRVEDLELARAVHATLIDRSSHGRYLPALAATFRKETDRIVFSLRPRLTFHDGTPLDAAAAVASIRRLLRRLPALSRIPGIPGPGGVEAIDKASLTIRIVQGREDRLLDLLCRPEASIVHVAEKEIIGAGPFVPLTSASGRTFELHPFLSFYRGRPFLDRVSFLVKDDPIAQRRALRGTGWDVVNLPAAVESPPGHRTMELTGEETVILDIDPKNPALGSASFRRAVSALDRDAMVQLVLNGRGSPARRLLGKRIFPLGPFPKGPDAADPEETGSPASRVTIYYPKSDMDLKMTAAKLKFELRKVAALLPRAVSDRELARRLQAGDFACLLRPSYVTRETPLLTLVEWLDDPLPPLPTAADDAELISRVQQIIDQDGRHLFLFHRPRRLAVAQDLVGVKTVMGIPTYEDAWHALP